MQDATANVVHVVQRLAPGGIETIVTDLVRDDPAHTSVISLEGTKGELLAAWPQLQTIRSNIHALDRKPGIQPAIVWALKSHFAALKPRAVFLHHIGPYLYGSIAARLARIPNIHHVEHDVWHYAEPKRRIILSALERATRLPHVAVSHDAAETIRRMLPGCRVSVIPNGVDIERFKPRARDAARSRFGLEPNQKLVGTAGRLVAVKGHDVLIHAAAHLPAGTGIAIAGDGPELQGLRELASKLGIAERIRFLGHTDQIEFLLPAFDVFCLPSHNEGMPRSILEAQACGLPVVATDVGAVREAVCKETGRIVPAGDSAALAAAITDVMSRGSGASPRHFTAERFSWQRTVSSYKDAARLGYAA